MKDKLLKNKKIFLILIIMVGLSLIVTVSYAFFEAIVGSGAKTSINATTYKTDSLTFTDVDQISLSANQVNFAQNAGDLTDSAVSSVKLIPRSDTGEASYDYYAYLNITGNDYEYKDSNNIPELVIDVTVSDGINTTTIVSNYDVTTKTGLINLYSLLNNSNTTYQISTTNNIEVTQTWTVTLKFLNKNYDQTHNEGKLFTANLIVEKDEPTSYSITSRFDSTITANENNPNIILEGSKAVLVFYSDINISSYEISGATIESFNQEGNKIVVTIKNPTDDVTLTMIGLCLAKGTKITMADGSTKNIEDIKLWDSVLTFDHKTGTFISEKVDIVYQNENKHDYFTLHFSNGEELSIVGIHDLFEQEEMKYVSIKDNEAEQFIGKHFYNADTKDFVELVSVTKNNEKTEFYSIYTEYNLNSIANNMLTVPDDIDMYLNIYEFNDDLTINQEVLLNDIKKYGLFDYRKIGIAMDSDSDKYISQYVYIIIGKGLATKEELIYLYSLK